MSDKAPKNIWNRILGMDERIIFAAILLVCIAPLIHPLMLPVPVTDMTRKVYNLVEALPANSIVCVDVTFSVGVWAEISGPSIAVWQHLFQRPVRIVFVAFLEDGSLIESITLKTSIDKGQKKYGVDWVELGYITGSETAVAAFAANPHKLVTSDYYKNPVADLPLMKDFTTAKDVSLWITGAGYVEWFIRQVYAPYRVPIVEIAVASQAPGFMPYLAAQQIAGMIISVAGGAEYELLLKRPGISIKSSDAISMAMLASLALVILGNVSYWMDRQKRKRGQSK